MPLLLGGVSLYLSSKSITREKMEDVEWVSAAVYDLRDSKHSIFNPQENFIELHFLLSTLEAMPHTLLSLWKRRKEGEKTPSLYDYNTIFLGENLRQFIRVNSKGNKKIDMPWDKTTKKMNTKVFKNIDEAEKMFPKPIPPPKEEDKDEDGRLIKPPEEPRIT